MLKRAAKFKVVSASFALSFLFIVGGWLWAYLAFKDISQPIILHFNSSDGITQVGSLADLAWVGLLGSVIMVVNFFIALILEERDWFLGKLAASATLFISILLFIGFAAIIGVN